MKASQAAQLYIKKEVALHGYITSNCIRIRGECKTIRTEFESAVRAGLALYDERSLLLSRRRAA